MKNLSFILSLFLFFASCEEIEKFEIYNREVPVNMSFKPVQASTVECPYGGYKTEVYVNDNLNTVLPPVCNGETGLSGKDGTDGKDGQDALPPVISVQETILQNNCKKRIWYQEINGNGYNPGIDKFLSEDTVCTNLPPVFAYLKTQISELCRVWEIYVDGKVLLRDTVCNGSDGQDGKDFDISDLIFETTLIQVSGLCKARTVYINGVEFYTDTICNGAQGPAGKDAETYVPVFSTEVIPISELCRIRNVFLDGELFFQDTICNGKDGKTGIIIKETFYEGCDDGDSYFYQSKMWNLIGTAFSINHNNSQTGNGSIVYWDDSKYQDTLWTPVLFSEPMSLNTLYFKFGSRKKWSFDVLAMDNHGNIILVESCSPSPASNFDWNYVTTYKDYSYSAALDELRFHNIVRIGFAVRKNASFSIKNRNDSFNMDEISVVGVKVN